MLAAVDDSAVEDQAHLVGAADVEVVADDLLEEDPPHTGWSSIWSGRTRLQSNVVAVAGGAVGAVNGCGRIASHLRSSASICAGPRLSQIACSAPGRRPREPVVQRLERNAGLGGLALRPVVAVDAQLGVYGK